MSDFNSPEHRNDPVKRAFDERREAAQHVGIETGLASVHRTNAPARRMAKAGGALLLVAAIIGGGFVSLQGGDEAIRTDIADESEQPNTTAPPASTIPGSNTSIPSVDETEPVGEPGNEGAIASAVVAIADGSGAVVTLDVRNPSTLTRIDTGLDGVSDAFDDGSGGLVLETIDGVFYKQPSTPMREVVSREPGSTINVIDVAVDGENAATTLWYTEVSDENGQPTQRLHKRQLDGPGLADLGIIGGVEVGASSGVVGYASGTGHSIVYLAMSDGPCTWLLAVDGSTGTQSADDEACVPEGDGTASASDMVRAVVIDENNGQPVVFRSDLLSQSDGMVDSWGGLQVWISEAGAEVEAENLLEGATYRTGLSGVSVRVLTAPIEPFEGDEATPDVPDDEPTIDAIDPETYRVIDVADDDVLFIREEPAPDAVEVGNVPNGAELSGTGTAARLPSGAEWYEVQVPGSSATGWVNARFLEIVEPATQGTGDNFAQLRCLVDGTSPTGLNGQTQSPADHVAELRTGQDGTCERVIVDLGQNFSFDAPGQPVSEVPAGVSVAMSEDGKTIVIDLGSAIEQANFEHLRAGKALVTNSPSGGLQVEILSGPANFNAVVLANPARIVIDYIPTTPTPGQLPVPLVEDAGVIVRSIDGLSVDAGVNVVNGTATVRGFARPFEAQMSVSMLDVNGEPFEGVTWNGGFQPNVTGSQYSVMADWQVMGSFEFTFDAPPGDYVLRLSGDESAADQPTFLRVPITVAQ